MRGRPTMIRNLVPGVTCRIRAVTLLYPRLRAIDNTDTIALSGRIKKVRMSTRSLIGHKSRRGKFFVEEVEE